MSEEYTLHFGQDRLLHDTTHRDHAIIAGVGYGKSFFGAPWLEHRRLENKKSKQFLIVAPTYKLLKKVSFSRYIEHLHEWGMREGRGKAADFSVNWSDLTVKHRNGQEVLGISGHDPNAVVGFTSAAAWLDEPALMDREIRRRVLKRNRCPKAKFRQVLHTTSPEGLNWVYDLFHPEKLKRQGVFSENDKRLVLHGRSHDNPYLDEEYLETLWDEFGWDEAYYANYVLGEWVSLSRNRFYFSFNEQKHVGDHPLDLSHPEFYLTFDFNWGKMAWAIIQRFGTIYKVVYANKANGRNAEDACLQFRSAFPPEKFRSWRISVLGDASGHSHSPTSNQNCYQVIRDSLRPHYPRLTIDAIISNPLVEERSRVTNRLFENSRLYINHTCTSVIASARSAETDTKRGIKKPPGEDITHPMEAVDMALIKLEPPRIRYESEGVTW